VAFKGKTAAGSPPVSPEALYRDLPRKPDAVPGLWLHQGDILRAYAADHADTPDLALELPTGTGKTLPGLLVADWVRRTRSGRAVYACPTRQLVLQVARTAGREGIPAVVLVGSSRNWPMDAQTRYEAAEALAVVTYSTVFNSSPKVAAADLILFDDAHAGEQYVAEQYAMTVRRRNQPDVYGALLTALSPALDGMLIQRLRDTSPDPGAHHQIRLVVPLRQLGITDAIDQVLSSLPTPSSFRYSMIRAGLPACLVYLTYSAILVRPVVPPTGDNPLFSGARQRVYLSATLGDGGELERSFGRSGIDRLALPATVPAPRSGRRYFVFPELVEGGDPSALAVNIVTAAGKALVLAPDRDTAVRRARDLARPGWPVLTVDDVADGMEPLAVAEHATCGLASRYDGLDLPGDDCRAVVLEGKPDQDSLQERFLSKRVRAGAALAERIRTRVIQGAGRCTRGPTDWAVVVVLGADLTKYLLRQETQKALDPELQAEIQFGLDNTRDTGAAEVLDNVRTFLAQGDQWRDKAEPLLADYRRAAVRELPVGTDAFAAAVVHEIDACALAARGRWADASRVAQDAARALRAGGDATRGYRALWLYLAGVWADQAAADAGDAGGRRTARALVAQAEDTAKPGTWTRDLAPLPDTEPEPLGPADSAAITAVAHKVDSGIVKGKHDTAVEAMLAGLSQTVATVYEPALTVLGRCLGADASKPGGKGRCDSTWCYENALWLAIEAKSEHLPTGVVPHKDIRQANDQLRLLAADRHQAPPPGSVTVVVSAKPGVNPDGARGAEAHVHLARPEVVLDLARDTAAAWDEILAGRLGRTRASLRVLIIAAFTRHGVLPSQVLDRLTDQPVAS
jgi:hypothetical protein